ADEEDDEEDDGSGARSRKAKGAPAPTTASAIAAPTRRRLRARARACAARSASNRARIDGYRSADDARNPTRSTARTQLGTRVIVGARRTAPSAIERSSAGTLTPSKGRSEYRAS